MSQTNCLINDGYSIGCKNFAGGIKEVYLTNWASDIIYTEDSNSGITNITSGDTAINFYKYEQAKETSGLDEKPQVIVKNGNSYFEQELTIVLNGMTTALRNQVLLITRATTIAIIKDLNDRYWLLGKDRGLDVNDGKFGTGIAYGDRNGYEIKLFGQEPENAIEVQYDAFSALIS